MLAQMHVWGDGRCWMCVTMQEDAGYIGAQNCVRIERHVSVQENKRQLGADECVKDGCYGTNGQCRRMEVVGLC